GPPSFALAPEVNGFVAVEFLSIGFGIAPPTLKPSAKPLGDLVDIATTFRVGGSGNSELRFEGCDRGGIGGVRTSKISVKLIAEGFAVGLRFEPGKLGAGLTETLLQLRCESIEITTGGLGFHL